MLSPSGEPLHVAYCMRSESGSWQSHGHDYYEIFYIDSGRGFHLLGPEARPVVLMPGQIVFIRPRDIHGFRSDVSTEPFALINVAFSHTAWITLRERYHLAGHPFFSEEPDEPPTLELIGNTSREIAKLFSELIHDQRSELVRDGFLLTLARMLTGKVQMEELNTAPAWLRKGLLSWSREPESWRNGASGLAKLAGCSVGHLARSMRKTLGVTPSEWIMKARLLRAANLLKSTGFSIADVALEAGFENLSHFHRCFRGAYGVTPLLYRKEHAKFI